MATKIKPKQKIGHKTNEKMVKNSSSEFFQVLFASPLYKQLAKAQTHPMPTNIADQYITSEYSIVKLIFIIFRLGQYFRFRLIQLLLSQQIVAGRNYICFSSCSLLNQD